MADSGSVRHRGLFLSYRREDSSGYAGRLFDRLARRFGRDRIFLDVAAISIGDDFVSAIEKTLASCEVVLVLIGKTWLTSPDAAGNRRLDDPADFVRLEVAAALSRDALVIPVLVGGASMPPATALPDALQPLGRRNAIEVSDTRFDFDVDRLLERIESATHWEPVEEPAVVPGARWVPAAQGLAVLVATAGVYVFPPPSDISGGASIGPNGWVLALVAVAGAGFWATLRHASGRLQRHGWTVALSLLLFAAALLSTYLYLLPARTVLYGEGRVVIGSDYTELAAGYVKQLGQQGATADQLLMDAAGDVARVWQPAGIRANSLLLVLLYTASVLSLLFCAISALALLG